MVSLALGQGAVEEMTADLWSKRELLDLPKSSSEAWQERNVCGEGVFRVKGCMCKDNRANSIFKLVWAMEFQMRNSKKRS